MHRYPWKLRFWRPLIYTVISHLFLSVKCFPSISLQQIIPFSNFSKLINGVTSSGSPSAMSIPHFSLGCNPYIAPSNNTLRYHAVSDTFSVTSSGDTTSNSSSSDTSRNSFKRWNLSQNQRNVKGPLEITWTHPQLTEGLASKLKLSKPCQAEL